MDIEKELDVITRSCVESEDGSYSQCFSSERHAIDRKNNIVVDIERDTGCWKLVNSRDKDWGRNGVNQIASTWAKGHMGEREADNFYKQYTRFRFAVGERNRYGRPKC